MCPDHSGLEGLLGQMCHLHPPEEPNQMYWFILLAFVDMGLQQLSLEVQVYHLKNKLDSCS